MLEASVNSLQARIFANQPGGNYVTDYLRLDRIDIRLEDVSQSVEIHASGRITEADDYLDRGQSRIPDTVGRFRHLVRATNIGAVRTPYWSTRGEVPGSPGVAVVSQINKELSVVAHLSPYGAIRLAAKPLDEAAKPYEWHQMELPPYLKLAQAACSAAVFEAQQSTDELP